jgi:hypothetical protein
MAFEDDRFLTARSTDDTIGADYDRVIQSLERVIYTFLGAPVGEAFTPVFAIDQDGNVQVQEELTFKNSSTIPVDETVDEITETNDTALATVTAIKNYVDSGSVAFTDLTDVDVAGGYNANYVICVNNLGSGLIDRELGWSDLSGVPQPPGPDAFFTVISGDFSWGNPSIVLLGDVDDYTGLSGRVLTVNTPGTALEWSVPETGVTDHSLLSNLEADDHDHYLLANGNRAVTGTPGILSCATTPTSSDHLTNKSYVDTYARSFAAVSGSGSVTGGSTWDTISMTSGVTSSDMHISGGAVEADNAGVYFVTVQARFAGSWVPNNPETEYGAIGAASTPGTNAAFFRWAVDGSGQFKQNTAVYTGYVSLTAGGTVAARALLQTGDNSDSTSVNVNMHVIRLG